MDNNIARSHNISVSIAICRICHSGEQSMAYDKATVGEPLISPCFCKGTIGLYHRSCLERWLTSSNTNACEICHFTYETKRRYRTFCEFISNKECYAERRNLVTDITCFIFLTPIVIGCITLCLSSSAMQTKRFQIWSGIAACQVISLLILSCLLSITYIIWLIVTIAFHIKTYLDWRVLHEEVYIVDQQTRSALQETVFSTGRIRRRIRHHTPSMRLLCLNLRSFLHDLCGKDMRTSTYHPELSGSSPVARERQLNGTISSTTLDINYNEFVRHLQPGQDGIYTTSSSRYVIASTPVPVESSTNVTVFDYPPILFPILESPGIHYCNTVKGNINNKD